MPKAVAKIPVGASQRAKSFRSLTTRVGNDRHAHCGQGKAEVARSRCRFRSPGRERLEIGHEATEADPVIRRHHALIAKHKGAPFRVSWGGGDDGLVVRRVSPSHYLNQDLGTVWLDK